MVIARPVRSGGASGCCRTPLLADKRYPRQRCPEVRDRQSGAAAGAESSSAGPGVGLLAQLQVDEALGRRTPGSRRMRLVSSSSRWSSSSHDHLGQHVERPGRHAPRSRPRESRRARRRPRSRSRRRRRIPIIAWRAKPICSGSVTATICMTPESSSRWTRWRTAASDSPTRLADAGVRPAPVLLQLLDDGLGGVVELRRADWRRDTAMERAQADAGRRGCIGHPCGSVRGAGPAAAQVIGSVCGTASGRRDRLSVGRHAVTVCGPSRP